MPIKEKLLIIIRENLFEFFRPLSPHAILEIGFWDLLYRFKCPPRLLLFLRFKKIKLRNAVTENVVKLYVLL